MGDRYEDPVIHKFPNATVKVYKPILTEEERTRRENECKKACAEMFRNMEQRAEKQSS